MLSEVRLRQPKGRQLLLLPQNFIERKCKRNFKYILHNHRRIKHSDGEKPNLLVHFHKTCCQELQTYKQLTSRDEEVRQVWYIYSTEGKTDSFGGSLMGATTAKDSFTEKAVFMKWVNVHQKDKKGEIFQMDVTTGIKVQREAWVLQE